METGKATKILLILQMKESIGSILTPKNYIDKVKKVKYESSTPSLVL
jgi:hypothetical protein